MSTDVIETGDDSPDRQSIDYDDCFDLLSNHRRRFTLHYMKNNGEEVALGELSEQVAAWENGIEKDEVSYDQRKRVYTSLQQVHLPRMDDMGVVTFDDREGVAALSEPGEELEIYLEAVEGRDVPWSIFYFMLVMVNAGFLTAGFLAVPPFSVIPDTGWAIFILTTFLIASVAHIYLTRTEMRLGEQETPAELSD